MTDPRPATDRTLDLRGEVCPYTLLKSRLAIEEMVEGQVLEVILDHRPAVEDVPKGLRYEGHEVLVVEATSTSEWRVIVRKGMGDRRA